MSFIENEQLDFDMSEKKAQSNDSYNSSFRPSCRKDAYPIKPKKVRIKQHLSSITERIIINTLYKQIIQSLTIDICDTFKKRNPCFEYDPACNPKRVLTKPGAPAKNDGFDNENSDFILYVHGLIGPEEKKRYGVLHL